MNATQRLSLLAALSRADCKNAVQISSQTWEWVLYSGNDFHTECRPTP